MYGWTEFVKIEKVGRSRDEAGLTAEEWRVIEDESRVGAVRRVLATHGGMDDVLDRLTGLCSKTIGVPVAAVSFVDRDRQVFKASIGVPEPWNTVKQMPLRYSICKHAVGAGKPLIVRDTWRHAVVGRNPSVSELGVRAYAGMPLITREGHALGTFNVVDMRPRDWSKRELEALSELTAMALIEIDQHLATEAAAQTSAASERRLEEALRARDENLAMTVHDLRNYLNVISLGIQLIEESGECESDPCARDVARVLASARQMDRLIEDLLDVSRQERGQFVLRPERVRVAALIRESIELQQPAAEGHGLALVGAAADSAEEVLGDRERLHRVLANLIGNAIKFTPAGGTITVGAERDGDATRFAVADTGPGIDKDDLPHVFDRFWQSNGHNVPGAGLGLAIAKGIVEAHGGRIWVESLRGRGATFRFTVPRTAVESRKSKVESVDTRP
jgi:signal transduction histidine kinase